MAILLSDPRSRRTACLLLAACGAPAALRAQTPAPVRLGEIRIRTRNVYSPAAAADESMYELVNVLHRPTEPEVVRREMWFGEGDRVSPAEVAELERNLRAMGLFGDVETRLVPRPGEPGVADLDVLTRDRFSLLVLASVARVGGTLTYATALGELNLFGTGKRIAAHASRNDLGETAQSVSYSDPQLAGTWHRLGVTVGKTEEGHFFFANLTRPFHHLTDPLSYGATVTSVRTGHDYFEHGASVADVPTITRGGSVFVARGSGPRDLRTTFGVELAADQTDYRPATGRDAALIRVPGNTRRVDAGPFVGLDWVHSYRKESHIDAIDYVEDLALGASARLGIGALARTEDGRDSELQPRLRGTVRAAASPFAATYLTAQAQGDVRWYAGTAQGWRLDTALHAFQKSLPAQTLAASLRFHTLFDIQNLAPQLTLGEDNGLRGYPAREFAGSRHVVLNVEDRIDTGLEAYSVHLGVAAFGDVGWVHGRPQGLFQSTPIRSVGIGLRLGSSELFGSNVGRFDLAFPLDRVNGRSYSISLSFSVGQVFSFFGNANALRTEF